MTDDTDDGIGLATLTDVAAGRRTEQKRTTFKPASEEGLGDSCFKRVSVKAMAKCIDQRLVIDAVKEYADHCCDYQNVSASDMRAEGKQLIYNTVRWFLSSTAVGNLATFGGRSLAAVHKTPDANPGIRALRAYHDARRDHASEVIFEMIANDMLAHINKKSKALLRTYSKVVNGEALNRIDALLTEKYGIIDNLWLLKTMLTIVTKGKWSMFYSNGRNVNGHLLVADDVRMETAEYGASLAVRNSEVGKASLTVRPSVFDWISGSGIIFDAVEGEALRRIHLGTIDQAELATAIRTHVDQQIPLFDECVQNLESLKEIAVALDTAKRVIYDFGESNNITKDERVNWLAGVEAEIAVRGEKFGLSAYGLVLGLARASNDAEVEGRDMELQGLAGSLASPSKRDGKDVKKTWERIMQRAASADAEKVEKLFATKV